MSWLNFELKKCPDAKYFLKSGKDIEIALTEIRQLQNEIDKLMEEEMHKKNIIDDLTDQRNQLQG